MSYKEYLHAVLDAVITKAVGSGKDYRSVIPIPYSDLASEQGMEVHKDMSALGIQVVIEITLTDKKDPIYDEAQTSDKNKTRH